jgi:hypothetical protein
MQWTLRGAHLLLQTRTKVLNNELEEVFRRAGIRSFALKLRDPDFLTHSSLRDNDTKVRKLSCTDSERFNNNITN